MILELNLFHIIIVLMAFSLIYSITYIYLYKKSIKSAENRYKERKEEIRQNIKNEFATNFEKWKNRYEKKIRKDAIKRSNLTLSGTVAESLAPLTNKINHDLSSLRYLGDPIDYIAFDNLGNKQKTLIYLLEIKSGDSKLSKNQKEIKKAIEDGEVYWETIRLD